MKKTIKKGGFNLIELLVVMAIIAVLVALVIAAINIARRASRDTTRRSNAQSIKAALEDYYARNKSYPVASSTNLETIASNAGIAANTLSDPTGDDNRYCYRRGAWNGSETSKYTLRVTMEGQGSGTPSCSSAPDASSEDFSQN